MKKNRLNKKYLVISHNYWPAIGGAEKLLQSIAEKIKQEHLEVDVLTSNAKNSAMYLAKNKEIVGSKREIINGVVVRREDINNMVQFCGKVLWKIFEKKKKILDNLGPLLIGPHFPLFLFHYVFSRKKYTHIICGPYPTTVVFYGYLMKICKPSVKFIIVPCIHINDFFHTGKLLRFISRRADTILVLTKEETIFFRSIGVKESKILEVGVGVDENLLVTDPDLQNITVDQVLYMGQEVPHKNTILLIEAMTKLWEKGSETKLLIAGAKTEYSAVIDAHIKKMNKTFQNNIRRENNFDEKRKIQLLDNCKIMILPSSQESFGIVFLEAWSRKKPVIGANVPAVRYLIENRKDGLLFENGDSDDLAEKIDYLLKNEDKATEFGLAGYKKTLEKYSWNVIINKIINI